MSFKSWKKLILIIVLAVISLAILTTGAGLLTWYKVKHNPIEERTSAAIDPATAKLGDTVTVHSTYKAPWGRKPVSAELTTVPGLLQIGEPEFKIVKHRWGWSEWRAETKLKTFRTGILGGAKLTVHFNPANGDDDGQQFTHSIPSCQVNEITVSEPNLQVAEAIPDVPLTSRERWLLYGVIALAVAVVILIIVLIRKRKRTHIIPPWTLALEDIATLHHELRNGKLSLEGGLSRLTDIVRIYLEKRFSLNTTRQTTAEFMRELSRSGGPLPARQRPFLSGFMTSADLVKFAKMPPDETMLNDAIEKAEILVNETRPVEEHGGKK